MFFSGAHMLKQGLEAAKLRATAVTYVTLLDAYGQGGEWQRALELWGAMEAAAKRNHAPPCSQEDGRGPELLATSACINACGKHGAWQAALEVFWKTGGIQHNQISFNAIISAVQSPDLALQLLSEMWRQQVPPSSVTYGACAAVCSWEEVLELWKDAEERLAIGTGFPKMPRPTAVASER
eukprot:Skav234643  [mRNA]  locus=scaffold1609:311844:315198:+ [translate_table: standard]